MNNGKNIFDDFINGKSKYFDLPDGEESKVKYLNVEPVVTNFQGKDVPCLRYYFEVNGKDLMWDRSSRELAKQMKQFSFGDFLKIRREGERNRTKYFIERVVE